jgi:hypothetical protein
VRGPWNTALCALALAAMMIPGRVLAQPFEIQPVFEHSSLVCWPDGNAPARSRERFGIVFDYELAEHLSAALTPAPVVPLHLMLQFNQCFGGGMIDDLFDFNRYPVFVASKIVATSASQHDEKSNGMGSCMGGSGYARPYAILHTSNPRPTQREAFLWAEQKDPFGPMGTGIEHPQYKSSWAQDANAFRIGSLPTRRGLSFSGQDLPVGGARQSIHREAGRTHHILLADYPAASVQEMLGRGGYGANAVCDGVPALARATRADLFAAIAALPINDLNTKEYYLWFLDHGQRWIFFFGPRGGVVPVVLAGTLSMNANADARFASDTQDTAFIFLESASVATVSVDLRINSHTVYSGDLTEGDNVLPIAGAYVLSGTNTIEIDNLSLTDTLSLRSIALGTGEVPMSVDTSPCDLDASGAVSPVDFDVFRTAFGHGLAPPDSIVADSYNPFADFDDDAVVTLADYQHWLDCYVVPTPGVEATRKRSTPGPRELHSPRRR